MSAPAMEPRRAAAAIVAALTAAAPLMSVFGITAGLALLAFAVLPAAVCAVFVWWALRVAPPLIRNVLGQVPAVAAGLAYPLAAAQPDPFGPVTLWGRLFVGPGDVWRRQLSVGLPVPFTHTFVDGAALYLGAATVCIVVLALGSRPLLATIVMAAVFGVSMALGVAGPISPIVLGLVVLCGVGGLLLATSGRHGRGLPPLAAATVVAAVAGSVLVTGVAPLPAASDPRRDVAVPVEDVRQNSPLAMLSSLLRRPKTTVFTAVLGDSGRARTPTANWVLATYDTYAGEGWQGTFNATPVGGRIAGSDVTAATTRSGEARVALRQAQNLLPHQSGVSTIDPGLVRFDAASDALISSTPLRTYSTRYASGTPTAAQLAAAAASNAGKTDLAVPGCTPPVLHRLAEDATSDIGTAGEKAATLQTFFTTRPFAFDALAAPGDSCARMKQFLVERRGTSQQFATAYALAARSIGLPARVAVGFGPGTRSRGRVTVTNADARAWVQVKLEGLGWVDFEPTPNGSGAYTRPSSRQPSLPRIQTPVTTTKPPTSPPIRPEVEAPETSHAALWSVVAALVVVMLLVVPSVVRTLRRRRRRRTAGAAPGVLEAWRDALVAVRLLGTETRAATAPRIAEQAGAVVTEAQVPLSELATLAERALYSTVSDGDVGRSWVLATQVRRTVRHHIPWFHRARYAVTSLI